MTQTELGKALGGISKQNISHMERGTQGISKENAKKLAKLFNVSSSVFI
jgi:DNA-binding XRE family transcriptional regulator